MFLGRSSSTAVFYIVYARPRECQMGRFFPPAQIPGIDVLVYVRASAGLTAQHQSA
jgi:hypothetical protein